MTSGEMVAFLTNDTMRETIRQETGQLGYLITTVRNRKLEKKGVNTLCINNQEVKFGFNATLKCT